MYEEQDSLATPPPRLPLAATVLVVGVGSVLGIAGAVIQELFSDPLVTFFAGPMIEETMKPTGLFLLALRFPKSIADVRVRIALGAWAGVCFGLIESWVYVNVYVDDPSPSYVTFRYTVPVALHATASAIFAVGVTRRVISSFKGDVPFLSGSWPWFVAAAGLHSAYNIGVTVLEVATDALSF